MRDSLAPLWHEKGATPEPHAMTNTIAIVLGLIIVAVIAVDYALFGSDHLIFLGKRMFELLDWIAFWR
ncbi:MAG: hypothetical protein QNJ09_01770 [Paracoccaceae bacterium]|nr:hypothetical protein [Paracoccaceae bacterium]